MLSRLFLAFVLLLPCSWSAPALLLPCPYYLAPAPYSLLVCYGPITAPPLLLPHSCSVLITLQSCPYLALNMLLPCF